MLSVCFESSRELTGKVWVFDSTRLMFKDLRYLLPSIVLHTFFKLLLAKGNRSLSCLT